MKKEDLKIGVYIMTKQAKQNYKNECFDVRHNAGVSVVIDSMKRNGFTNISYCSSYNVAEFDMVMFSVTSDCDWWQFIAERVEWPKGRYKVVVGGAGVLNPRPFLSVVDYFVLGRGENLNYKIAEAIANGDDFESDFVVTSKTFSMSKEYRIKQTDDIYPHDIKLENGITYHEDVIGCNHKCLFCGYTWHRKHTSNDRFRYTGLWGGLEDKERAIIDMVNGDDVDLNKLRTTAIDGMSERLRYAVNKKISREALREFLHRIATCEHPHQLKLYNIVGYPTETEDDWNEFLDDIAYADKDLAKSEKQTCILLHSTPFRPMPATPMACQPMSYVNYRGKIARDLGKGKFKGNVFFQGNAIWAVESMGTESLPTVIKSAIIWRGEERDFDNIVKIAKSKKFESAGSAIKQATLEKYFDVGKLFGKFDKYTLPTRNIRTYSAVEKMW